MADRIKSISKFSNSAWEKEVAIGADAENVDLREEYNGVTSTPQNNKTVESAIKTIHTDVENLKLAGHGNSRVRNYDNDVTEVGDDLVTDCVVETENDTADAWSKFNRFRKRVNNKFKNTLNNTLTPFPDTLDNLTEKGLNIEFRDEILYESVPLGSTWTVSLNFNRNDAISPWRIYSTGDDFINNIPNTGIPCTVDLRSIDTQSDLLTITYDSNLYPELDCIKYYIDEWLSTNLDYVRLQFGENVNLLLNPRYNGQGDYYWQWEPFAWSGESTVFFAFKRDEEEDGIILDALQEVFAGISDNFEMICDIIHNDSSVSFLEKRRKQYWDKLDIGEKSIDRLSVDANGILVIDIGSNSQILETRITYVSNVTTMNTIQSYFVVPANIIRKNQSTIFHNKHNYIVLHINNNTIEQITDPNILFRVNCRYLKNTSYTSPIYEEALY